MKALADRFLQRRAISRKAFSSDGTLQRGQLCRGAGGHEVALRVACGRRSSLLPSKNKLTAPPFRDQVTIYALQRGQRRCTFIAANGFADPGKPGGGP
jgi:hypothetical protein